jgi:hypothetical protein
MQINFKTATTKEIADWLQYAKSHNAVVLLPQGFFGYDEIYKLTEAYRIMGQKEGYKRGKRDGSYAGYQVGYDKGFDDGYNSCMQESYEECCELRWWE